MRVLPVLLLAACGAAPLPDATGKGLTVHTEPPSGVDLVGPPTWEIGATYSLVVGGNAEVEVEVIAGPTEDVLGLRDQRSGVVQLFDAEIGRLGEAHASGAAYAIEPADVQCAWPLWVGKRWTSHFVIKAPGRAVAVEADYHCDAQETVGGFRCLRIWRHAKAADDPDADRRSSVAWYSPTLGYFVRRLADGVVTDCVLHSPPARIGRNSVAPR